MHNQLPPQSPRSSIIVQQHHQPHQNFLQKTEAAVGDFVEKHSDMNPLKTLEDRIEQLERSIDDKVNEKLLVLEKRVVEIVVRDAQTIIKNAIKEELRETEKNTKKELIEDWQNLKKNYNTAAVGIGTTAAALFCLWYYTH